MTAQTRCRSEAIVGLSESCAMIPRGASRGCKKSQEKKIVTLLLDRIPLSGV